MLFGRMLLNQQGWTIPTPSYMNHTSPITDTYDPLPKGE